MGIIRSADKTGDLDGSVHTMPAVCTESVVRLQWMGPSCKHIQCESKKSPPRDLTFFHFFSQTVENL